MLPSKPNFSLLFNFWKDKSIHDKSLLILNLFIFEYLHQILPWKEIKETFSV